MQSQGQLKESEQQIQPLFARSKHASRTILCTLIASMILLSCGVLTQPSQTPMNQQTQQNQSKLACPELTPLNDDTFKATTLKLLEVTGFYWGCRASAIGATINNGN